MIIGFYRSYQESIGMSFTKLFQRTTMPFDGGLSPLTDKSRQAPLFGDTPLIQDILNHSVTKNVDIHGRGSWGNGDDVSKSYRETGDEFMMDNKIMEILKRLNVKQGEPREKWVAVTIDNKTIEFPSYEVAQQRLKEKGIPYRSITRKVAQNTNHIDKALNASFEIQSYSSATNLKEIGSAFAISEGIFLTCAHCVKKYNKLDMPIDNSHEQTEISLWKNGKKYPAKLLNIDFVIDAALIRCNVESKILNLGSSNKTRVGTNVVAIGSPSGYEENVTEGILSSRNRKIFDYSGAPRFLFTDAQVLPGSSGGALVSLENGDVIGMMALIVTDQGLYGLNAAVPSEYLIKFVSGKI